jgi:hypothetical protein
VNGLKLQKAYLKVSSVTHTNIYEKRNVRQVGYLQELNQDARATEHKIEVLHLAATECICTRFNNNFHGNRMPFLWLFYLPVRYS